MLSCQLSEGHAITGWNVWGLAGFFGLLWDPLPPETQDRKGLVVSMDWNTLKFLLACRGSGVRLTQTLTIGRQGLSVDDPSIRALLQQFGALRPELDAALEIGGRNAHGFRYIEGLLKFLGAEDVTSIDASDYEGATVIHDMNVPLPTKHEGRYDFVFDGGTLEHIFHFPTALRSCMAAVKTGGHLLIQTPINNWCGHGFYQFSPELY